MLTTLRPLLSAAAVCLMTLGIAACGPAPRYQTGYTPSYDPFAELRRKSISVVDAMAKLTQTRLDKAGEEKVIDEALASARHGMKDPDAAQFRNVRLVAYNGGHVVCGEVNGKNSYGAYVGYTPFVASTANAQIYDEDRSARLEAAVNAGLTRACGS